MPISENGELLKKIETLVEDDEISQRAAVILTLEATGRVVGDVGQINKNVSAIQSCIKDLTDVMKENPSILWLLRYKTKGTVTALFSIFLSIVAATYLVIISDVFRQFVITQLGLPIN